MDASVAADDSGKRSASVVLPSGAHARRSKKGKKQQGKDAEADRPPDVAVTIMPLPPKDNDPAAGLVRLDAQDKGHLVQLDEAKLSATSAKGYRMVRATHGAHAGTWYYEIEVKHLGATGHCRLGWATKQAELQAPVGYDSHSFAYRDIGGAKVHKAAREPYGQPFQEGDVIGCLLHMPEGGRPIEPDLQDKPVLSYGGIPVVEVPEEAKAEPLPGSCIAFTKNGKLQGMAYRDVTEGKYYPAGSIYTLPEQAEGATLCFNYGPAFKYPCPVVEGLPEPRPVCELGERYGEAAAAVQDPPPAPAAAG
mmetsp:Transcript_1749/g.4454  ORF Transcript_1749/g.4454 Transcript_1749/m.4454 type:complete len:307 (+) Transcript_1749:122-1042(+)